MEIKTFIADYREAFGVRTQLPIAFWYSAEAAAQTEKAGGCLFKHLNEIIAGKTVSLNAENIGCGGGKFYCGFSDMPEYVPQFVSVKERYKQSPELVLDMVASLGVPKAKDNFLNFTLLDNLDSFEGPEGEGLEGLLFLATPDVLSGLVSWATFDRNEPDVVSSLFGSGCGNVVTQAAVENAKGRGANGAQDAQDTRDAQSAEGTKDTKGGYRSFIGFFDPSVRPYVYSNILSFTIPMSRFRVMYDTMRRSCLFDTHAWGKIRERIASEE